MCMMYALTRGPELGTFGIFLIFSIIKKNNYCIFYQFNLTGGWAFYIGLVQKWVINLIISAKKSDFIIEKI